MAGSKLGIPVLDFWEEFLLRDGFDTGGTLRTRLLDPTNPVVDNGDGSYTFSFINGDDVDLFINDVDRITYVNGVLTVTYANGDTDSYDIPTLREVNPIVNNGDGTYTFHFTDGNTFTTEDFQAKDIVSGTSLLDNDDTIINFVAKDGSSFRVNIGDIEGEPGASITGIRESRNAADDATILQFLAGGTQVGPDVEIPDGADGDTVTVARVTGGVEITSSGGTMAEVFDGANFDPTLFTVTDNKVGKTTTVTILYNGNTLDTFDILDGADGSGTSDADDLAITGSTLQITENGNPVGTGIRVEAQVMDEDGRLVSSKAVFDGLAGKVDLSPSGNQTITAASGNRNIIRGSFDLELNNGQKSVDFSGTSGDLHLEDFNTTTNENNTKVLFDRSSGQLYMDPTSNTLNLPTSDDNKIMRAGGLEIGATSVGHADHPGSATEDAQIILGYEGTVISRLPIDGVITATAATDFIQNGQSGRINFVLSDTVQANDEKPVTSAAVNTAIENYNNVTFGDNLGANQSKVVPSDSWLVIPNTSRLYLYYNHTGNDYTIQAGPLGLTLAQIAEFIETDDILTSINYGSLFPYDVSTSAKAIPEGSLAWVSATEQYINLTGAMVSGVDSSFTFGAGWLRLGDGGSGGGVPKSATLSSTDLPNPQEGDTVYLTADWTDTDGTKYYEGLHTYNGTLWVGVLNLPIISAGYPAGLYDSSVPFLNDTTMLAEDITNAGIHRVGNNFELVGNWQTRTEDTNALVMDINVGNDSGDIDIYDGDAEVVLHLDSSGKKMYYGNDINTSSLNSKDEILTQNNLPTIGFASMLVDAGAGSGATPNWVGFKPLMTGVDTNGADVELNFAVEEASEDLKDHVTTREWQEANLTTSFRIPINNTGDPTNIPSGSIAIVSATQQYYNITAATIEVPVQASLSDATTYFNNALQWVQVGDGGGSNANDPRFSGTVAGVVHVDTGVTVSARLDTRDAVTDRDITIVLPTAEPSTPFAVGDNISTSETGTSRTVIRIVTVEAGNELILDGHHASEFNNGAPLFRDAAGHKENAIWTLPSAGATAYTQDDETLNDLISTQHLLSEQVQANSTAIAAFDADLVSIAAYQPQGAYLSGAGDITPSYSTDQVDRSGSKTGTGYANTGAIRVYHNGDFEVLTYLLMPEGTNTDGTGTNAPDIDYVAAFEEQFKTEDIIGHALVSGAYNTQGFPHVMNTTLETSYDNGFGTGLKAYFLGGVYQGRVEVRFQGTLTPSQNSDRTFITDHSDRTILYDNYTSYQIYPTNAFWHNVRIADPEQIFLIKEGVYLLHEVADAAIPANVGKVLAVEQDQNRVDTFNFPAGSNLSGDLSFTLSRPPNGSVTFSTVAGATITNTGSLVTFDYTGTVSAGSFTATYATTGVVAQGIGISGILSGGFTLMSETPTTVANVDVYRDVDNHFGDANAYYIFTGATSIQVGTTPAATTVVQDGWYKATVNVSGGSVTQLITIGDLLVAFK